MRSGHELTPLHHSSYDTYYTDTTTRAKNAASGRFTDGVYKNILDPTQIYTKYVKILARNFFQSELYLETHYEIILEHTYI